MEISSATAEGRRSAQEDRFLIHETDAGALLVVADGVNGSKTAAKVIEHLPELFNQHYMHHGGHDATFKHIFEELNRLTEEETSGAAVSFAWVTRDFRLAIVGVLGDCPVRIFGKEKSSTLWSSPTHDVNFNAKELSAAVGRGAVSLGGCITTDRKSGTAIQLSRMLGYRDLAPILNRKPEVMKVPLKIRATILLATDGLKLTDDEIFSCLSQGYSAQQILEASLAKDDSDNTTVIVCRALPYHPHATVKKI